MAALFETIEIPSEPSASALALLDSMAGGPDGDSITLARRLFEQRPVWSKLALSCYVDVTFDKLKKILQCLAYYWLSGPWRTMWCRMGYDPRKDPTSKVYQMIDFRVRENKENKVNYSLVAKRSAKNYIPRNLAPRGQWHGSSVVLATGATSDMKAACEESPPYIFKRDKAMPSRNMMYQLCDLNEPELQQIIHENDGQEGICDERDGFFRAGVMARIRSLMLAYVNEFMASERLKRGSASAGAFARSHQLDVASKKDSVDDSASPLGADTPECTVDVHEDSLSRSSHPPQSYMQLLQGDIDDDDFEMDALSEMEADKMP